LSNYDVSYHTANFTITKAPLSAQADGKTKVYGDVNPTFTGTLTGVKNSDAITATYSSAATAASGVGVHAIVPQINGAATVLANYQTPVLTNGTLTITKAPLSVTASSPADILFGAPVPTITAGYSGFKNGQTAADLTSPPVCTTNYTVGSPLGPYTTSCTGAASPNYDFGYHPGGFNVVDTAPSVALAANNQLSGNEGTTYTYAFSITDSDPGDSWTFAATYPSCGPGNTLVGTPAINNALKTGSFQCKFVDGPSTALLKVKVKDAASVASNEDTQSVVVSNLPPAVTFTGPNVLSGLLVFGNTGSFSGSFTDPGVSDNPWVASFTWDGVADPATQTFAVNGSTFTAKPLFTSAGCTKVASVKVTDKDGGVGTQSKTISVGTGEFLPPMSGQPVTDKLKNGQVLPVKVRIADCNGNPIAGLSPKIELRQGDQTDGVLDDATTAITPESVSSADTTGFMRQSSDGTYIYNMRINFTNAQLNTPFTVVITPNILGYVSTETLRHKIMATK
jgi:hypothetical protein